MLALNANDGEPLAYNANFTIKELKTALSKEKSTAPGGDTVHYDMLKQLNDKAKFQLLHLINKSWNKGELPTQWKESTIIPLLKPNKDPHQPQSYRPISLTSAICKTMETMVATRLTAHLENNNCLAHTQSGFRKHRSTIDQITWLESAIRCAKLEKRVFSCCISRPRKSLRSHVEKRHITKINRIWHKRKNAQVDPGFSHGSKNPSPGRHGSVRL